MTEFEATIDALAHLYATAVDAGGIKLAGTDRLAALGTVALEDERLHSLLGERAVKLAEEVLAPPDPSARFRDAVRPVVDAVKGYAGKTRDFAKGLARSAGAARDRTVTDVPFEVGGQRYRLNPEVARTERGELPGLAEKARQLSADPTGVPATAMNTWDKVKDVAGTIPTWGYVGAGGVAAADIGYNSPQIGLGSRIGVGAMLPGHEIGVPGSRDLQAAIHSQYGGEAGPIIASDPQLREKFLRGEPMEVRTGAPASHDIVDHGPTTSKEVLRKLYEKKMDTLKTAPHRRDARMRRIMDIFERRGMSDPKVQSLLRRGISDGHYGGDPAVARAVAADPKLLDQFATGNPADGPMRVPVSGSNSVHAVPGLPPEAAAQRARTLHQQHLEKVLAERGQSIGDMRRIGPWRGVGMSGRARNIARVPAYAAPLAVAYTAKAYGDEETKKNQLREMFERLKREDYVRPVDGR